MTRHLIATLAFGLTLAAGFALGSIGHQPDRPPPLETDIPTIPPVAAVIVPLQADDHARAESNLFPAPQTLLQMAESLGLDETQRQQIRQIQFALEAETMAIGRRILDEERRLERAFAEGNVDSGRVDGQTARIANLQGRLRAARLRGHLSARDTLTPEQVLRFASLRGYQPSPANPRDDLGRDDFER
ncbi:MAG: periplasmic heavy metal sensor [Ferrovibrio sp.]|jgi:Spy/CpxP family protein refolding chaperone|uniref:periplasmic heavy metal sensor n=1 Tax=Ferrovibrio sp. TaxID=1917215 RepID=UPI00391C3C78